MVDISKHLKNFQPNKVAYTELDAAQELNSYGLEVRNIITDGNIHRVRDRAKPGANENGWYVMYESGGVRHGAYGSWSRNESIKFCSVADKDLTVQQKMEIRTRQRQAEEQAQRLRNAAAQRAETVIEASEPANPEHPYLVAKGVKPHQIYQKDGDLLIPAVNSLGEIRTYQSISPDGTKLFLKHGEMKGSFYWIGKPGPKIYLAEGYATAATIHELTGHCVYIGFNAGNLLPVAQIIRENNPHSEIIIAADNDQWALKPDNVTFWNPGIEAANLVASKVPNCRVIFPEFKDVSTKPTDFNDLLRLEGHAATIAYLNPKQPQKQISLIYASDMEPVTKTTDFVEDVLRDNEFSVIYGESNCGKTFFMLDLAMHVALGLPWRNKAVDQGGVIYAALEGGHGTKNRIVAFKRHYGIEGDIPLAVVPSNLNFVDPKADDIEALAQAIQEAQYRLGNVRLIVIDTLARAISGGDENSSVDMGQLIVNADILRGITGAHISFIHHSGKDTAKGARGHSSLRAAVDTEIEISRPSTTSPSLIKVVKQREMEMIPDMAFTLERVVLGMNDRNKEISSCVVSCADVVSQPRQTRLSAVQQFIYDCLIEATLSLGQMRTVLPGMPQVDCVYYDELREIMERKGFKEMMATKNKTTAEQVKSATQTARMGLKKAGKINFDNKFVWVVSDDK